MNEAWGTVGGEPHRSASVGNGSEGINKETSREMKIVSIHICVVLMEFGIVILCGSGRKNGHGETVKVYRGYCLKCTC